MKNLLKKISVVFIVLIFIISSYTITSHAYINYKFVDIAIGDGHVVAVTDDGKLLTWGHNTNGQLGNGNIERTTGQEYPFKIQKDTLFKKVAAQNYSSFAIDMDGNIWAWGENSKGQLGNGTTTDASKPQKLSTSVKFVDINSAGDSTFAIDVDGFLWAWGDNSNGQLGDGTENDSLKPKKITGDIKFKQVSSSGYHTLAIDTDGYMWSWGKNLDGALGIDETNTSVMLSSPTRIKSDLKFIDCNAYSSTSYGIDEEGYIWSWGDQDELIGIIKQTKPILITNHATFVKIYTDGTETVALDTNGNIWGKGPNYNGELGTGDKEWVTSIDVIIGRNQYAKFEKLFFNRKVCMAVDENGELWGWGGRGYFGTNVLRASSNNLIITSPELQTGDQKKYNEEKANKDTERETGRNKLKEDLLKRISKKYKETENNDDNEEDTINNKESENNTKYEEEKIDNKDINIEQISEIFNKYKVMEDKDKNLYLCTISPNTTLANFKANCSADSIVVYKQNGNILGEDEILGTGMKVALEKDGVSKEIEIAITGDIDGNGKISITDFAAINEYLLKELNLEGVQYLAGDISNDNKITITDFAAVNQILLKELDVSKIK